MRKEMWFHWLDKTFLFQLHLDYTISNEGNLSSDAQGIIPNTLLPWSKLNQNLWSGEIRGRKRTGCESLLRETKRRRGIQTPSCGLPGSLGRSVTNLTNSAGGRRCAENLKCIFLVSYPKAHLHFTEAQKFDITCKWQSWKPCLSESKARLITIIS